MRRFKFDSPKLEDRTILDSAFQLTNRDGVLSTAISVQAVELAVSVRTSRDASIVSAVGGRSLSGGGSTAVSAVRNKSNATITASATSNDALNMSNE